MSTAIFFLPSPRAKAFAQLSSTAADPDKFLFVARKRHRDVAKNFIQPPPSLVALLFLSLPMKWSLRIP